MHRLFIALPLSKEIISGLKEPVEKLRNETGAVKTVSPENLHLTLKFLGDTDEETMNIIMEKLPAALTGTPAIPFEAAGCGAFPSPRNPSVFWCGINVDHEALSRLHEKIETCTTSLGFARDRRAFRPHITLGRLRRGRSVTPKISFYLKEMEEKSFGCGVFDRVILYKSDLTPEGPRYSKLRVIKLKIPPTGM